MKTKHERKKAVIVRRGDQGESFESFAYLSDSGALAVPEDLWGCVGCLRDHDFSRAVAEDPRAAGCGRHEMTRWYYVVVVATGLAIPAMEHEVEAFEVMDAIDGLDWSRTSILEYERDTALRDKVVAKIRAARARTAAGRS